MSTKFDLSGRRVAVVGGSGLLGSAISRAARDSGAEVLVLDVAEPAPDAPVRFHPFDVTEFDDPAGALDSVEAACGPSDVWINSAYPRTTDWGRPEAESSAAVESWRRNLDMQLSGPCAYATAMAERMAGRGGGVIVAIASIYGVVAPDQRLYEGLEMNTPAAYAAIKGGLIAHTRLLASRFGPKVRANVLCPGGIERDQPEVFVERYGRRTCLGRMATADEIAWPAVFLASDAAAYMTGTALMVDGGLTAL